MGVEVGLGLSSSETDTGGGNMTWFACRKKTLHNEKLSWNKA